MTAAPASTSSPSPARLNGLWRDAWSALATVVLVAVIALTLPRLIDWAATRAVRSGDGEACRGAAGACWAFLRAKFPFIMFGIYPAPDRWRPIAVILLITAMTLWSLPTRHWTRATLIAWLVVLPASILLMGGGFAGLAPVPTSAWGGLPVTLLLTVLSLAFGLPLGILLALARRAPLPVFRWLAAGLIEGVRALPLLTLLFIAAMLTPLLLPGWLSPDNLTRATAALSISAAAYFAEVIRGGLQGVSPAQEEAARALGLTWSQAMRLIVLPQALAKVLPPLTNTVVLIVKNTSLVLVLGLFDLLSASRVVLSDPAWPMPFAETYLLTAATYFVICFGLTRYARYLEGLQR